MLLNRNTNIAKTSWGFFISLIEKYTPLRFRGDAIESVFNYLPIDGRLCTSGQPTEQQFANIQGAEYTQVINLAPHATENALSDEASLLAKLGLRYIHIQVDFKNPTEKDFEQFASTMQAIAQEKVWVHCAANMRVSAFLYRYRCAVLGADPDTARRYLEKIWEPFGVWKDFISPGSGLCFLKDVCNPRPKI